MLENKSIIKFHHKGITNHPWIGDAIIYIIIIAIMIIISHLVFDETWLLAIQSAAAIIALAVFLIIVQMLSYNNVSLTDGTIKSWGTDHLFGQTIQIADIKDIMIMGDWWRHRNVRLTMINGKYYWLSVRETEKFAELIHSLQKR